jgi:hypothetical protein
MQVFSAIRPYLKNQDLTIYEFMPLPGDPTPEEIEQQEKEQQEQQMAEARRIREDILSRFNSRNGGL